MRRTQQNADRQRRRGVRSRLVACVAAVAMLVTSVAAGTAVAAELGGGDAADQTTQNTATLEQQGTGDTGDNNQTTTNGDGQADGDQSSDADSGSEGDESTADNGAADGTGTTESDVQLQGDAAAKSANAVPAPQSEAADANADAGVSAQAEDTGTNLLTETFTGSTPSNQDAWKFFGAAGLTKAGDGRTQNQSGTENVDQYGNKDYRVSGTSGSSDYFDTWTDNKGPGYLQLTDNQGGQTGTVLYNEPVQSSLGLDVQFYMWQFNSASTDPPADGTGFFLVDGSTDLSKQGPQGGNYGGALGYSAMEGGSKGEDGETVPGLANGVLGVGFDTYGNYSSKRDVGGSNVRTNNGADVNQTYSVTVRGAGAQDWNGDWTKGYDILAQKQLNRDERSYLQTSAPSQTGNRTDKENVGNQANGTLVSIHITPSSQDLNGDQYITITLTDKDGRSTTPINGVKLQEKLPALVKFGFSASTGSNKDVHFIRGLEVSTVLPAESNILMTKTINHDETQGGVPTSKTTFAEGETVPYTFVVKNVGGKTLTNVHIEDNLLTNVHLQNSSETSTTLEPGEQVVFYGSLILTKDQARQGSLTNTAVAKGNDGEKYITDDGSVTITTVVPVEPLGTPDHTKRIGDNGDGTYTLALDVTGKTQTSGGTTTTPVDVVMIIDRSSSMNKDITTSSETTYSKVDNVVESDGRIYTDTYWDSNWPFRHEYQHAEQTTRPTDTYYVYLNGGYVEVEEQTNTVYGGRGTSYQDHVSWTAGGQEVDPASTPFYTQHTSSTMSRIAAVKQAANAFVDSAAASAGASHIRIGVVSFAGTDSSEDTSSIDRQLTAVVGGDGTSNAETIKRTINAINAPKSDAGTYPDDGFKDANSMLSSSPEGTRKVVIFFTDGGPGGGSNMWGSWDIENGAANDAVEAALPLKKNGATIYSVGVLDNADPKADISNVTGNSEDTDKINAFMHAVSSNYPKATGFAHNQIGTRTPNSDYYKVAEDAEQLNEIFQDIFHDSTKTQAYGNVSIVDELSQWAQVADSVKWDDSEGVHTGNGYPVTEGVSLEVKDADGNPVREGDPNYPNGVKFYYEPVADGATDTTGTVRAVFADTYQLQDKWTYTLKFDVKPTDAAYMAYAANEYKVDGDGNTSSSGTAQIGADGTNLYTDSSNTPKGGKANTSAGKPGFRSNKSAYVEYSEDGESQDPAYYDHPVLQVSVAPVVIGSGFGLREKKTVVGDSATEGEFNFTVTAKPDTASGTTAVDAAVLAGWTACTGGVTDGCYTASGSEVVYSFTNPNPITDGDSEVVRQAGNEDGATTFTPDMVGRTFTYVYAESDNLPDNWYNQSDVPVWTVTATVDYADDTKSALKVTVRVYHGNNASGDPAGTYVYTGENQKPTHTGKGEEIPTVSFTNTYVAPVSALPLTGGDSTARTLLLAGGGVLLVAGAAWLLARRRRV